MQTEGQPQPSGRAGRLLRRFGVDAGGSGSHVRTLVAALFAAGATLTLWRDVALDHVLPSPLMVVVAVLVVLLVGARIPRSLWLWWGYGALSLVWTLAPGNSLVALLWSGITLAAFAAGSVRWLFVVVHVYLLFANLTKAAALDAFGVATYLSGSVNYVTGALALVLLPLALWSAANAKRWYVVPASILVATASGYAALISGARAVYVPLLLILALYVVRASLQRVRWRALGTLAVTGALVWLAVALMPSAAVASSDGAAPDALAGKVTVEALQSALASHGAIRNRLRLWHQALDIALDHPFGAGLGAYRAVVHSHQLYPMVWSSSAHNVFVEHLADLGWIGLLALLLAVAVPIWRLWRSPDWPLALALAAVWFTLSVDVTASHIYMMATAFATLGLAYARLRPGGEARSGRWGTLLSVLFAVTLLGAGVARWIPCDDAACSLRWHGAPASEISALLSGGDGASDEILTALRRRYPESLWVVDLERELAPDRHSRHAALREIALRFPYFHPQSFLNWAESATELGRPGEAEAALRLGFATFPPGVFPFAEQRLTPAGYRSRWVEPASALLARIERGDVAGPR